MHFSASVYIHMISELTFVGKDLFTAIIRAMEGFALLGIFLICSQYLVVQFFSFVTQPSHFLTHRILSAYLQVSLIRAYASSVAALIALGTVFICLKVAKV